MSTAWTNSLIALAVTTFLVALFVLLYSAPQSEIDIPLVRDRGRRRFRASTFVSYLFNANDILQEAYDTYLKHGKTCRVPDKSLGTMILIPNRYTKWMLSQPQGVLNSYEAIAETVQARWTLGDTRYLTDNWHLDMLRAALRPLSKTGIVEFQEELERSMANVLGNDYVNWKNVNPTIATKRIILQATTRYLVGSPLCADEQFLRWILIFIEWITPVGELLRLTPRGLRSVVGHIFSIPRLVVILKLKAILRPQYDKRLSFIRSGQSPEDGPQDYLQMMMRDLYERNSADLNLHFITINVLVFGIAAVVQPYMLAPSVLYDILESDAEYNTIAELQEELVRILGEPAQGQRWSQNEARQMTKLDSVLREALRTNTLVSQTMPRKVMVDSLQTPDGFTLSRGATVALLARAVQTDPDIYPNPSKFIPFRHAVPGGKRFAATGEYFLAFGHAKHACPGRFLVSVELKMLVAHILRHYHIELPAEYGGKRPKAVWFTDLKLPPQHGVIRVKRRV
ncbi:cytochrome P450 [Aspergillus foveolatus]|uniref:cytochrome P450 n=1 Tax=Aspergillus foveolatus TaxID=210207 RepID=UPI003CCCDAC1